MYRRKRERESSFIFTPSSRKYSAVHTFIFFENRFWFVGKSSVFSTVGNLGRTTYRVFLRARNRNTLSDVNRHIDWESRSSRLRRLRGGLYGSFNYDRFNKATVFTRPRKNNHEKSLFHPSIAVSLFFLLPPRRSAPEDPRKNSVENPNGTRFLVTLSNFSARRPATD